MATRALKSGALIAKAGIGDAINQFNQAEKILSDLPEGYFKSIAFPSAQILKGIAHVYERKLDEAEADFWVATTASYPGLRARAYNDLGYVKLIKSDVETAERMFTLALAADAFFPLAQTNLGYVYMAQGKYEAAKRAFQGVAEDPLLQQESMRDVFLSKVALAHIQAIGLASEFAPDAYNEVMRDMKLFDYDGVQPASLRLAFIQAELGDKLYQDPKYYGLEIFALTMYARAYLLVTESGDGGASAVDLKMRALRSFKELRGIVDKKWFVFQPSDGFFRPVYEMSILGEVGDCSDLQAVAERANLSRHSSID
jgi:tetratricopeptide (TPR) repeat protein